MSCYWLYTYSINCCSIVCKSKSRQNVYIMLAMNLKIDTRQLNLKIGELGPVVSYTTSCLVDISRQTICTSVDHLVWHLVRLGWAEKESAVWSSYSPHAPGTPPSASVIPVHHDMLSITGTAGEGTTYSTLRRWKCMYYYLHTAFGEQLEQVPSQHWGRGSWISLSLTTTTLSYSPLQEERRRESTWQSRPGSDRLTYIGCSRPLVWPHPLERGGWT